MNNIKPRKNSYEFDYDPISEKMILYINDPESLLPLMIKVRQTPIRELKQPKPGKLLLT